MSLGLQLPREFSLRLVHSMIASPLLARKPSRQANFKQESAEVSPSPLEGQQCPQNKMKARRQTCLQIHRAQARRRANGTVAV